MLLFTKMQLELKWSRKIWVAVSHGIKSFSIWEVKFKESFPYRKLFAFYWAKKIWQTILAKHGIKIWQETVAWSIYSFSTTDQHIAGDFKARKYF